MEPLTDQQIRASFVNATRREVATAALPDLGALPWSALDYLGWSDRKAPLSAYVVAGLAGGPVGILLRASEPAAVAGRRKALCAWCTDVTATDDVSLYVARRAGAPGRNGDTIGTLVCTDFSCSRNVRRTPSYAEAGGDPDVQQVLVEERTAALRDRVAQFVTEVARTR